MSEATERRKDEHLDVCLREEVGSGRATLLSDYELEYDALPELDLEEVDLSVELLGRRLRAPLLVGAMTGGTPRARSVNRRLARAAARVGVGMALGSQRAMIARPELTDTFAVRDAAPDLPLLLGNVGAVQLGEGVGVDDVERAVRAVDADGLFFHLNPLHEAIQPEGQTRFRGLRDRLADAAKRLPFPVLVKEVGAGISEKTARKLAGLPIAGVEVAGVGGTSWARVESYRAAAGSVSSAVGQRLAGFGVPTARSIVACRELFAGRVVVASGGIRTGHDAAVALALGADAVAFARPLLEAATESEDAAVHWLETFVHELRVLCFCTGARDVAALRNVRVTR